MRHLLLVLLFALVLAGGAVVTWKAMGQAKLVQDDLTTARSCSPAPAASSPASSTSAWR